MTRVDAILGPGGAVAASLPGWEERPQQLAMAQAVERAFESGGRALIEAGTGTGKTLGYLVPALLSGKRTLVSTATRTLQHQIAERDIPFLTRIMPRPFRAVVLKGRQNYLCWEEFERFRQAPEFSRWDEQRHWPEIVRWTEQTETGDRAELRDLPDDFQTWNQLTTTTERCLGRACEHHDRCFVVRAREAAAEADVVIVNHHLFFADVSIRATGRMQLLPEPEALVFDEAHHLESVAASFFTRRVSNVRVRVLVGDILRDLERESLLTDKVRDACTALETIATTFFDSLDSTIVAFSRTEGTGGAARAPRQGGGDAGGRSRSGADTVDRLRLADLLESSHGATLRDAHTPVDAALRELGVAVRTTGAGELADRLAERCSEISSDLRDLMQAADPDRLYLAVRDRSFCALESLPLDVRPIFQRYLFPRAMPQVFTSATLTTDGNFSFLRARLGVPRDAEELELPPAFDYMQQALLYVPQGLPAPTAPDFVERIVPEMLRLIEITDGRAFLLFTSYRNMNRAHQLMRDRLRQRVLLQGEQSRESLLDTFRADVRSVLFATSSFWEGVDVQGESLSLVVIDKLPFASPVDPAVEARMRHIEAAGGNAFRDYQVPEAAIALKQGVGRLIRHRNDVGIIALMDQRLVTKGYGKRFLASLPRTRRTQDLDLVTRWWAHQREAREGRDSTSG